MRATNQEFADLMVSAACGSTEPARYFCSLWIAAFLVGLSDPETRLAGNGLLVSCCLLHFSFTQLLVMACPAREDGLHSLQVVDVEFAWCVFGLKPFNSLMPYPLNQSDSIFNSVAA